MSRAASIRRRLVVLLLGSMALVWAVVLAAGYVELHAEVDELADARLEQNARTLLLLDLKRLHALSAGHAELHGGADHHARHDGDHDDDDRLYVDFQVWSRDGSLLLRSPGAPAARYDARAGHAELAMDGAAWNTYALDDAEHGYQVRVFESAAARRHALTKMALRMTQLLLLALPALALLVWLSIGQGLAPLTAMAGAIAKRDERNLEPLPDGPVPVEVRPLADALNRLLARLSASLARERAFTADAAHELRTPLAAIKVQAEVALAAADEKQRRQAITQVIAGVNRTTRLAQQLLQLARLDEAEPPALQPVDLARALEDSAARYAGEAERKGMEFDVALEPGCVLQCDPAAVAMMADNLVDNAVKYGRPGGRVELCVAREAGALLLRVRDDGPGVAPAERARLTDRFFRVEGTGVEGSGLGLSIVARIAARYGGTVSVGEGLGGTGLGIAIRFPLPAGASGRR